MEYKKCYLYGLKSKKKLLELLHIDRKIYCKSSFLNQKVKPFVSVNNGKGRLIEAPDEDLKNIQIIILRALQLINVPDYVFSGIKGKCYIDNSKVHTNKKFLFKIDISKFFPNISRDKVYRFYKEKLNTSSDVAQILTDLTTVNLELKNKNNKIIIKVNNFISKNDIKQKNHLITGSPISSIMSFLANIDMFEAIHNLSMKKNIVMTAYVDDIVFTSNNKIDFSFRKTVLSIIERYGYKVSLKKCKWYNKPSAKKVTGVILDKNGSMQVPNKLMLKIHNYIEELKHNDNTNLNKLQGCLVVTNSINGKMRKFQGQLKNFRKKK